MATKREEKAGSLRLAAFVALPAFITCTPLAHAALAGNAVLSFQSSSWWAFDIDDNGSADLSERAYITMNEGVRIGQAQPVDGQSHSGIPTGAEVTSIDMAWLYFGNTGMHETVSPVTTVSDDGFGNVLLDFSGWRMDWNSVENIPLGGDPVNYPGDTGMAQLTCSGSCGAGDTYSLDYSAHVPIGDPSSLGGIEYLLHLEGTISAVPVPAAVWLFGSGLLGLLGVARRRGG